MTERQRRVYDVDQEMVGRAILLNISLPMNVGFMRHYAPHAQFLHQIRSTYSPRYLIHL